MPVPHVDFSAFAVKIQEKISFLVDPASFEIPEDPVLVHYQNSDLRIMSEETLRQLHQEFDECHKIIDEFDRDPSGVRIALKRPENWSEMEEVYAQLITSLLEKYNFTTEGLLIYCSTLWAVIERTLEDRSFLKNKNLPPHLINFISKNKEIIIDLLNNIYGFQRDHLPQLVHFFQKLFYTQLLLVNNSEKKLIQNGIKLESKEVFCPYTREKIDLSATLASQIRSGHFLAIFIGFSQFAAVKESEIDDFLKQKDEFYLQEAQKTFVKFLFSPNHFSFSQSEKNFLNDLGIAEIRQKWLHTHSRSYEALWASADLKTNVLKILRDYNKENLFGSKLGLFFTGHWNRHHQKLMHRAIASIESGENIQVALNNLLNDAKNHPNFNVKGALVSRLEYISLKSGVLIESLLNTGFAEPEEKSYERLPSFPWINIIRP
nr:hypothetical protein [Legionella jordanis]